MRSCRDSDIDPTMPYQVSDFIDIAGYLDSRQGELIVDDH